MPSGGAPPGSASRARSAPRTDRRSAVGLCAKRAGSIGSVRAGAGRIEGERRSGAIDVPWRRRPSSPRPCVSARRSCTSAAPLRETLRHESVVHHGRARPGRHSGAQRGKLAVRAVGAARMAERLRRFRRSLSSGVRPGRHRSEVVRLDRGHCCGYGVAPRVRHDAHLLLVPQVEALHLALACIVALDHQALVLIVPEPCRTDARCDGRVKRLAFGGARIARSAERVRDAASGQRAPA